MSDKIIIPTNALVFLTRFGKHNGQLTRETKLVVAFKREYLETLPCCVGFDDGQATSGSRLHLIEYHAHGKVVYCWLNGVMTNAMEATEIAKRELGIA